MKKRKGKITIGKSFIEENDPALKLIFSNFIPVHVENNYSDTNLVYYGYSEMFDELGEGEASPEYIATIYESGAIDFKRI